MTAVWLRQEALEELVQPQELKVMLTAEAVGTTRVMRKPPRASSAAYSSSVRSTPPVIASMMKSIIRPGWGWLRPGSTLSTNSSRGHGLEEI